MDETQSELHDKMRKQLITFNYNNGTRYIKFVINDGSSLKTKGRDDAQLQLELSKMNGNEDGVTASSAPPDAI